jgi:hypothetical protein
MKRPISRIDADLNGQVIVKTYWSAIVLVALLTLHAMTYQNQSAISIDVYVLAMFGANWCTSWAGSVVQRRPILTLFNMPVSFSSLFGVQRSRPLKLKPRKGLRKGLSGIFGDGSQAQCGWTCCKCQRFHMAD